MEKNDNTKEALAAKESRQRFKAFFRNAKLSWGWIAASAIVTIGYYFMVSKLPGSTSALMAGRFTNKAIMDVVLNYSLTLLLLVIVGVISLIAEARTVRSVRKTVWTRMMGIKASYYGKNGTNQLLSAVTSDAEVAVARLMTIITLLPGLVSYLVNALNTINGFSPKLMWAVFVMIPLYALYAVLIGRWQYKVGYRIQMKIGGLTGYLTDRIRNLTTVKSYVMEEKEEAQGYDASSELYKSNIEYAKLNSVMVGFTIGTEVVATVVAVIWGCILLQRGEIDLQSWLAFFLFVPTINSVFRQLAMMWSNFKEVQGRASRLGAIMEAPQENLNAGADAKIPAGDIRLEDVTFSYGNGVRSLDHVSLTIPQGKTTAIVGHSGSGKTTVLRLLERLYSPDEGKIVVGNQNLEELNLTAWRNKISYVTQGADLFGGTIRECLCYGIHREISDAELDKACKMSGIDEFIALQPKGYDQEMAIWGSAMSGGQRQRMVIARELLRDAEILILDEPTSALDAETAAAISRLFFTGFEGKTIIAVTHELGFVTHADRIAVMDGGEVTGVGTHEELMETNAAYRELVEQQSYQEVFE